MSHLMMEGFMLHMHLMGHTSHMSNLLIKFCLLLLQDFLSVQFLILLDCLGKLLNLLHHMGFI